MLEQLEYMKRWALQDQSALTKEQLCKGFVQMCDDALRELSAQQPHEAAKDTEWTYDFGGRLCPICEKACTILSSGRYPRHGPLSNPCKGSFQLERKT